MSPSKSVARAAAPQRLPKRAPSSRLADDTTAKRHRARRGFLLGAGRRLLLHGVSAERRARCRTSTASSATRAPEFFAPPPESEGWAPFLATLAQRAPFRDVLHCLGTPASGMRYLSFSGQPVFDQRNKFKGYRGIARDVSAQIRAERLARLEHTIAHTLAEADDVASGLSAVIRAMCEAQGWTAGNFWSVDAQRDTLWHEVGWNEAGEDRRSVLNPGDRLPTWLSHGPVWIGDVVRDPRTSRLERAETAGWNTGLVIPVKAGGSDDRRSRLLCAARRGAGAAVPESAAQRQQRDRALLPALDRARKAPRERGALLLDDGAGRDRYRARRGRRPLPAT